MNTPKLNNKAIGKFLTFPGFLFGLSIFLVLVLSIQSLFEGDSVFLYQGQEFRTNGYNNYVIFKQSFFHLLKNENLYTYFPAEHWDLFKYSPTIAFLMGLMAWLPDPAGLFVWNLLNALAFLFGLYYLPRFPIRIRSIMFWIVSFELFGSIQNEQSNALIAGLIILGFGLLERRYYFWAILCLMLTVYIKLFGLVAFSLLLLFPHKIKLAGYSLLWAAALFLLPLAAVSWQELIWQYGNWIDLLQWDHGESIGLSVMGWLESWFGIVAKTETVVAGVLLFCLPLLKFGQYRDYSFRLLMLASVLIWVVIFNHRAESPTFILALAGVLVWYFTVLPTRIDHLLLFLAVFFISFAYSDFFPGNWRESWVKPLILKGLAPSLVWGKIIWDLITGWYQSRPYLVSTEYQEWDWESVFRWRVYRQ